MKITLWFAGALVLMVALTYGVLLSVSHQVIQKTVRDGLIETVENLAGDVDQFMAWKDGYLEVDDDFLDQVNGIYTALYDSSQSLLYGENPIAMESLEIPLENAVIRKLKVEGVLYYIFDREL